MPIGMSRLRYELMMNLHCIRLPFSEINILELKIGDKVLLSGEILTARDAAHKRIVQLLDGGEGLPFDLSTTTLFYCGPSPSLSGRACGAIGPTTSSRMDLWTPRLMDAGLRVMIGKGERSSEVKERIERHGGLYLISIGGAAAYMARRVVSCETFLWPDLGAEAIHRLIVKDFPAYVAIV